MTATTKRDAISAAMGLAEDIADGKLTPAALEARAVAECRELVGTVVGPGDPCWDLQLDVARQVLALDGIPVEELSEWLAVSRQRAGQPGSDETTPTPRTLPGVALRADSGAAELTDADALADAEPEPVPDAEPEPVPDAEPQLPQPETVATLTAKRRADDSYDPLRGWGPSHTLQGLS